METKFQTSFIPKKPITPQNTVGHAHTSASVLMIVGVLLFVISLGGAVLSFFGEKYFLQVQAQHKTDLEENEKRYNIASIEELKKANTKIGLAKQLLKNHVAVSESLTIIAALTAEKVYFTSFKFFAPESMEGSKEGKTYKISMSGVADSFNSIAFQSDVFGKSASHGTNKVIKNPILSNLAVDDKGKVKFDFTADIMADDISYEKVLNSTLKAENQITE